MRFIRSWETWLASASRAPNMRTPVPTLRPLRRQKRPPVARYKLPILILVGLSLYGGWFLHTAAHTAGVHPDEGGIVALHDGPEDPPQEPLASTADFASRSLPPISWQVDSGQWI